MAWMRSLRQICSVTCRERLEGEGEWAVNKWRERISRLMHAVAA